ncbi:MAG: acyl-CoA thioesterase [Anaerolineaceae bacterium]
MALQSQIRVLYGDCDPMRIAYYANYLRWFEIGRTEWLRQGGIVYRDLERERVFLPVVEARCFYKKSALYDDLLTIRTSLGLESVKLLRFDYEILRAGELLVNGYTLHLCLDKDRKVQEPPKVLLELLDTAPLAAGDISAASKV